MNDREKVINVLSNYKSHAFGDKDEKVTVEEIIALLKDQEPRLVTEADFENADAYGYLPVWVEYKDGEIVCDCITITAITNPDVTCDYRFWTSKPSDEQRKAVKWE